MTPVAESLWLATKQLKSTAKSPLATMLVGPESKGVRVVEAPPQKCRRCGRSLGGRMLQSCSCSYATQAVAAQAAAAAAAATFDAFDAPDAPAAAAAAAASAAAAFAVPQPTCTCTQAGVYKKLHKKILTGLTTAAYTCLSLPQCPNWDWRRGPSLKQLNLRTASSDTVSAVRKG